MSTLAFTSLPPEVQAFLKEKGLHRFKTVEVSPFYREDVVRELPPIPVNLENTNKPAAYSYAVSPSGHSVRANYNRVMGAWPHHTEEVAESIQLPVEHGPWTIIHVPRNWAGAELGVSIRHGKLDTRYQSQKSKLTGLAAAMLYVYGRTRGMYRKRSTEAMESYERQVGPVWTVVRDELLEQGLVTIQKGGQLRVTPRGAEVAGRIPASYDPDNWVYRRTAEATHMPPEGLFGGLGATTYGGSLPNPVRLIEVHRDGSPITGREDIRNALTDVVDAQVDLLVPTKRSRTYRTPMLRLRAMIRPTGLLHTPGAWDTDQEGPLPRDPEVPTRSSLAPPRSPIPARLEADAYVLLTQLNQPFRFENSASGPIRNYSRWYRIAEVAVLQVELDRLMENIAPFSGLRVYRRTAEATHMPPEGLFGLGAHVATADMGTVTVRLTDPDPTETPPREFDLVMRVNVLQPTPNEPDQRWRMRLTAASREDGEEDSAYFITHPMLPENFTRPFIVYGSDLTDEQSIPYKATIHDAVWKESTAVNMDRVMESTVTPYQRPRTVNTFFFAGRSGWGSGPTLEEALKTFKRYGYQPLPQLRAAMKRGEAVGYRIEHPEGVNVSSTWNGGLVVRAKPGVDPSLAQVSRLFPIKPEGRSSWREEPAEPHKDSDLDGLGATPRKDIAFNVITGRRSNPPNVAVSTVKLPDYGDGDAPFETMVFPSTGKGELLDLKALDSARTDNASEALRQHRRMMQKWAVGTSFNGLGEMTYPPTGERVRYGR